jgi:hypothetical protein
MRPYLSVVIPFRPSSHSSDYSLIGECATVEDAKELKTKVAKRAKTMAKQDVEIDWELPETRRIGERVIFTAHTDDECTVDELRALMKTEGSNVEGHNYYQELKITITAPKGATYNTLPLLLSSQEATFLKVLRQHSRTSELHQTAKKTLIRLEYRGSGIYNYEKRIFVGIPDKYSPPASWKVQVRYSADKRWLKEQKTQKDKEEQNK